ncbi:hypothetical protein UFOVP764_7 [uncultured Caudovirales phage]|uniref:Uncharacterized protein n=1 Tax=uncultured Caudovirales phage TaxID=2100421 RepID=A0A6J5NL99_9CAUD|nr:hypothetical protein UFOVP764_7 [uncultured Caudovirales phage]
MHIYLKHPVHGTKVAIAELEAKYDERNGWVRYNPETSEVISVNALEIKRKYTRRAAAKEG